ncbi:MAG: autotransporter outer membrane beta-barrel domain-containing protein, partial [Endomicrobium sp.]|nr:autotransporter outer membrane beta-barrel domain-containing protein [Endomicrobium sp.]
NKYGLDFYQEILEGVKGRLNEKEDLEILEIATLEFQLEEGNIRNSDDAEGVFVYGVPKKHGPVDNKHDRYSRLYGKLMEEALERVGEEGLAPAADQDQAGEEGEGAAIQASIVDQGNGNGQAAVETPIQSDSITRQAAIASPATGEGAEEAPTAPATPTPTPTPTPTEAGEEGAGGALAPERADPRAEAESEGEAMAKSGQELSILGEVAKKAAAREKVGREFGEAQAEIPEASPAGPVLNSGDGNVQAPAALAGSAPPNLDPDSTREVEDGLGFVGNMIRSVGSVSYREEVFREMVRLVKDEEEKGEKWKVYGKGKYKQITLEGTEKSPGEYKDSQVGGVIGVTRWLGEEDRGFVIGAFVGFDSHSMTQKGKEEKKGTGAPVAGAAGDGKAVLDLGEENKGRATSGVLGLCGGYIDPNFEVRMLIRGRLNKYKVEKLPRILDSDKEGMKFDGRGFGVELEGKYKIRVSKRVVMGPWIGMEASIESYDEDKGKTIKKGDYSRALLGVGWEVRTKVGDVGVVNLKAGYRRLLSGEIPKIKIGEELKKEKGVGNVEGKGTEEGKDIGEVALGLSLDLGKGFGTSVMVKYAVAKHFHDIGANLGFSYKF